MILKTTICLVEQTNKSQWQNYWQVKTDKLTVLKGEMILERKFEKLCLLAHLTSNNYFTLIRYFLSVIWGRKKCIYPFEAIYQVLTSATLRLPNTEWYRSNINLRPSTYFVYFSSWRTKRMIIIITTFLQITEQLKLLYKATLRHR